MQLVPPLRVGRLAVFDDDYARAEQNLAYAFEHCSRQGCCITPLPGVTRSFAWTISYWSSCHQMNRVLTAK
jgi:hypothetical protein